MRISRPPSQPEIHLSRGLSAVCSKIVGAALDHLGEDRLAGWLKEAWQAGGVIAALRGLLENWCRNADRPVVLMLDEVDGLAADTLKSVLLQIGASYAQRPKSFPQAIILCGVRDREDYPILTVGSALSVLDKSLRVENLSPQETQALWLRHQEETGQPIDPAIFSDLWEDTLGQPWLVNALGKEVTWKDQELRDRAKPIALQHYLQARERLLHARVSHLTYLAHKLQEDRVRPIVTDILQGGTVNKNYPIEDLRYVEDLGLIETQPQIRVANRIYQEVILRELTQSSQADSTQLAEL
jgi:hypothetical protein